MKKEISDEHDMLVTILTLSYYSPDLYAAVDSVLRQDYPRIQYILVDDGTEGFSTEFLSDYIEANRSPNLEECKLIQNPENYGTVRSSNIGLKYANGEYIFLLAGDDVFTDSSVIKDWVKEFVRSGALVMTAYRDVYDRHMKRYLMRMPDKYQVRKIKRLSPEDLFEKIAGENIVFGCCTAYSRRCLEKYGCFDERYRLIEDHSMILRLLRQGVEIKFWERSVIRYRENGVSAAGRHNKAYEHDADLIFKYEVMPFTRNLKRAQRQFSRWRRRQRLARDFQGKLYLAQGNLFRIIRLRFWFHAHHPIVSVRGLLANPVKLKKFFRNE